MISRHNQDVIYFGSNRFHRSLNRGDEFKNLSGDLTKGPREGDVTFGTLATIDESPLKFGLLYTGSDDGLIHISKDGGYTWTNISAGLPTNLWVSRVVASAHNEGTVYASLNGYRDDNFIPYVFVSTNYGQTWQPIGTNLPNEPVNVVKEDPKNPNLLYVGTDHGVYVSMDKGKSFMRFAKNLPAVAVHDLVIHPRDNELIVGTHGRSLYTANIEPLQQLTDSVSTSPLHVYTLKPIQYSSNWGRMFNKYEDAPEYRYDITYYAKQSGQTTVKIQTVPKEGDKAITLRTLSDTTEAGLNYLTFNYTIDSTQRVAYEKFLNDARKKEDKAIELKVADDKKLYLRPGKYKLVIESNGARITKDLEVKAPDRRGRRAVLPNAYAAPDEFENWMEESGVEESK